MRWPVWRSGVPVRGRRTRVRLLGSILVCGVTLLVAVPAEIAAAAPLAGLTFENEGWTDGLIDVRSLDLSRTDLVTHGFAGRGLQVVIPRGGFRGLGPFDRLEPARNQVWYRYHIRLLDWRAAFTGKLPGLAGIYSSSARGCKPPTESAPGWSARGLFGVPGTHGAPRGEVPIGTYLYHADQEGICGDALWWGVSLQPGRWHCIEGQVRMNTPGENDGLLRAWFDGKEVYSRGDIEYRTASQSRVGVRHMWHNVYFGGSWSTPNSLSLIYDQAVVSSEGRIGCLSPFRDIGGSVHANSLVELHARGLLYGCAYRSACPRQDITRGQAAALFSRIIGLPSTNRDYFSDDDGHIFEGAINRLARAGITEGCRRNAYCPEQTLTREQFATMVVRALDLGAAGPNAFRDDDGRWSETAIDTLAHAGLTEGCTPQRFCPRRTLTRGEAATFFLRVLDRLEPLGLTGFEPPPDFPPEGEPPPIPPEERD